MPGPDEAEQPAVTLDRDPSAKSLRDSLLALPDPFAARIDASAVERLSGSALQTLAVLMRDASSAGRRVAVVNPSFAFTLAFEAYGLGGEAEPFTVEYS